MRRRIGGADANSYDEMGSEVLLLSRHKGRTNRVCSEIESSEEDLASSAKAMVLEFGDETTIVCSSPHFTYQSAIKLDSRVSDKLMCPAFTTPLNF
jgi:hypothetical protein